MTENTGENATATAGNAAGTEKVPQERELVAQEWLDELALAEAVAKAAKVEGRADALLAQDVTQPFVADLLLRIGQAGDFVTAITTAHVGGTGATRNEGEAKAALIKAAGTIQSGAKRKFSRSEPERLALYACGGGVDLFNMNRAQLSLAIPTLIKTAKLDALSGTGDAKTNAVQAAFDAWNAHDDAQTGENTAETTAREALHKLLFGENRDGKSGIIFDRRTVQYAADAAWPPGTDIAIRREFHLQDKRRYSG